MRGASKTLQAVLIAGVALTVLVSCGHRAETIALTAKVTEREIIDDGPPGVSRGDMVTVHAEMSDETGKVVADLDFAGISSHLDQASETRVITGEMRWRDSVDSLVLMMAADYPRGGGKPPVGTSNTFTIVGGTGRFAGKTGEVTSTAEGDSTYAYLIRLE